MTNDQSTKTKHLEWAIKSRNRNQQCALRLLTLFYDYELYWKTQKGARFAQESLSVVFSLWRAAFLADKKSKRTEVFSDATQFLEGMIEDNAVNYLQDKNCKEWTFNYYTRNARAALETMHKSWPEKLPAYVDANRSPTERWEYCQNLLDEVVKILGTTAFERQTKLDSQRKKKEDRAAAKNRRKKVREITKSTKIDEKAADAPNHSPKD